MNKFMPQSSAAKIWVLFMFGYSAITQYRNTQTYGGSFLSFLIDFFILFLVYYFFFYALPSTIFQRIKNRKNTNENDY